MRRWFSKKRLIVLSILAIIAGAAVYAVYYISQPAVGNVAVTKTSDPSLKPASYKTLDSPYIKTQYPDRYEVQKQNASASLDAWILVAHQKSSVLEASQISIIVTTLPAGGVKEDSAYKLFEAHPELYTLKQTTYSEGLAYTAKRTSPTYQQTVLLPHGKYLLTVGLMAGRETDLLDSELQGLFTSLSWHD